MLKFMYASVAVLAMALPFMVSPFWVMLMIITTSIVLAVSACCNSMFMSALFIVVYLGSVYILFMYTMSIFMGHQFSSLPPSTASILGICGLGVTIDIPMILMPWTPSFSAESNALVFLTSFYGSTLYGLMIVALLLGLYANTYFVMYNQTVSMRPFN